MVLDFCECKDTIIICNQSMTRPHSFVNNCQFADTKQHAETCAYLRAVFENENY